MKAWPSCGVPRPLQPADVNHVLIATALPVIYESLDDCAAARSG